MTRLDIDLDSAPPHVREWLMDQLLKNAPAQPHREERQKPITFTPVEGPESWRDQPLTNGIGSVKVFPAELEMKNQAAKLRGLYP